MRHRGGSGQPAGPYDVPLELVGEALGHLVGDSDRLAVLVAGGHDRSGRPTTSPTPAADAELGLLAWPHLVDALGLEAG